MAIFDKIDLTNITEKELINIMDENRKKATFTRREITKLEKFSQETYQDNIPFEELAEEELFPQTVEVSEDTAFEDEISYYLEEMNNLTTDNLKERIRDILPEKSDYDYQKVLLRIMAELIKNIKENKEFIDSYRDSFTQDDLQVLREDTIQEQEKLGIITNILKEKEIAEIKPKSQEKNNLILVPTSGGNIRVLEEISHIPVEYYECFIGLFNSIKDGTFKNMRRFQNHPIVAGISEVKDSQARVVYDRLDANNYAIITAFVKKTQNGTGYQEHLINRISNYKEQYQSLKDNLDNEEFIELQKDYEKELYRKLGTNSKKVKQKGVN